MIRMRDLMLQPVRNEKEWERLIGLFHSDEESRKEFDSEVSVGRYDDMDDDEYLTILDGMCSRTKRIVGAIYDCQAKEIRPNQWLMSFLSSFSPCKSLRISKKQADIFARNGEQWEDGGRRHSRHIFKYNGYIYDTSHFGDCGYITIREVETY